LAPDVERGSAIGVLNGVLVEWVRIPALITTLGTYYIALALAQMISAGEVLRMPENTAFVTLQTGEVVRVPLPVMVAWYGVQHDQAVVTVSNAVGPDAPRSSASRRLSLHKSSSVAVSKKVWIARTSRSCRGRSPAGALPESE